MLSFSAVKLVKVPLGSTNKVKVKSSPLIVKFMSNSFKDSPVDVRVVIQFWDSPRCWGSLKVQTCNLQLGLLAVRA